MSFLDDEDVIVETDIDLGRDKKWKNTWKKMLEEFANVNTTNLIYNEDLYTSHIINAFPKPCLGFQSVILIPVSLIKKCLIKPNYINIISSGICQSVTLCIYGHSLDKDDSYDSLFDEHLLNSLKSFKGIKNSNIKIEEIILYGVFKDLDTLNKISSSLIENLGLQQWQIRTFSSSRIIEEDTSSKDNKIAYKIMYSLSNKRLVLSDFTCNIYYKLFPLTLEHPIKKINFDSIYKE